MKKLFFSALLIAGTTLAFAKDNVKSDLQNTITKEAKQTVKTSQTNSTEEDFRKATCTDVHAFFNEVTVDDGNGGTHTELEYAGSMEVSYDCDNAQVSLYIWID